MDRVTPDFSAGLMLNDEKVLIDRVYDHVHVFDWLGYALLKLITEEGVMQVPLNLAQADAICVGAGIIPIMRHEISVSEHEYYLEISAKQLEQDFMGELDMTMPPEPPDEPTE